MSFLSKLFGKNKEDNNLEEAVPTNCDYEEIKGFVELINKEVNLSSVFNLELILSGLGGKINKISLADWNEKKYNFVNIFGPKKFTINICETFPEDINRLLFAQALGAYFMHSQSGLKPCFIKEVSIGDVSKETLHFALHLLMSDVSFVKLKESGMDNEKISNMFRVPLKIIDLKENILKKFNIL